MVMVQQPMSDDDGEESLHPMYEEMDLSDSGMFSGNSDQLEDDLAEFRYMNNKFLNLDLAQIDPFDEDAFEQLLQFVNLCAKYASLPVMGDLICVLVTIWGKQVRNVKQSIVDLDESLRRLRIHKSKPITRNILPTTSNTMESNSSGANEEVSDDDNDDDEEPPTREVRRKLGNNRKTKIASDNQISSSSFLDQACSDVVLRRQLVWEQFKGMANGEMLDCEFNMYLFYDNGTTDLNNLRAQNVDTNMDLNLIEVFSTLRNQKSNFECLQPSPGLNLDSNSNVPVALDSCEVLIDPGGSDDVTPSHTPRTIDSGYGSSPVNNFTEEESILFKENSIRNSNLKIERSINKLRKTRIRLPFEPLNDPTEAGESPEVKRGRLDFSELAGDNISATPLSLMCNREIDGDIIRDCFGVPLTASPPPDSMDFLEVSLSSNLEAIFRPPSPICDVEAVVENRATCSSAGINMENLVERLTETAKNLFNEQSQVSLTDLLMHSRLNVAGAPTREPTEVNDSQSQIISVPLAFMAVLRLAVSNRLFAIPTGDGSLMLTRTKPADSVPSLEHSASMPKNFVEL